MSRYIMLITMVKDFNVKPSMVPLIIRSELPFKLQSGYVA